MWCIHTQEELFKFSSSLVIIILSIVYKQNSLWKHCFHNIDSKNLTFSQFLKLSLCVNWVILGPWGLCGWAWCSDFWSPLTGSHSHSHSLPCFHTYNYVDGNLRISYLGGDEFSYCNVKTFYMYLSFQIYKISKTQSLCFLDRHLSLIFSILNFLFYKLNTLMPASYHLFSCPVVLS